MKFSFLIILLLAYSIGYAQHTEIDVSKKARISHIISLFKQKNILAEKNAADITLDVEKDNRKILSQHGTLIAD